MLGGKTGTNLGSGDRAGWVCLQCIVGWANLCVQPCFYRAITGLKRTQTIADYFAFRGVLAGSHLGFDRVCHVVWQGDAQLLSCTHGRFNQFDGI